MTAAEKKIFLKGVGVGVSIRRLTGSGLPWPRGQTDVILVTSVRYAPVNAAVISDPAVVTVTSISEGVT